MQAGWWAWIGCVVWPRRLWLHLVLHTGAAIRGLWMVYRQRRAQRRYILIFVYPVVIIIVRHNVHLDIASVLTAIRVGPAIR